MHEAARIVRDDVFRAGLDGRRAFHVTHRGGDHRKFRSERAAKTAAGLGFGHFDELQALDVTHQRARRFLQTKFAQAVATIVERDLVRKFGAEIRHAEFGDKKIRELPGARGDLFGEFFLRLASEEFGIKFLHHRAAGTGTDDDRLGIFQLLQNFGGDGAGFIPVAGVERRLAAAGDFRRADDRMAKTFEDLHHADARARKQRVHETGDEKRDRHSNASHCLCGEPKCH